MGSTGVSKDNGQLLTQETIDIPVLRVNEELSPGTVQQRTVQQLTENPRRLRKPRRLLELPWIQTQEKIIEVPTITRQVVNTDGRPARCERRWGGEDQSARVRGKPHGWKACGRPCRDTAFRHPPSLV